MKGKLGVKLWGIVNQSAPESIHYQIAFNLLSNIYEMEDTSSQGLARLCHVSKPSISRFCKELGYESFMISA